jgi:YHS domain-containing protein
MGVGDSATGRGPAALLLADDVQAFAVALAIYLRGVYAGQVVPGGRDLGADVRRSDEEDDMAAIDPVCGMSVDEGDAPEKLDHEGTTYYFCSTDCRQEFEANPEDYAN